MWLATDRRAARRGRRPALGLPTHFVPRSTPENDADRRAGRRLRCRTHAVAPLRPSDARSVPAADSSRHRPHLLGRYGRRHACTTSGTQREEDCSARAAKTIRTKSPTSLKLALRMLRRKAQLDFRRLHANGVSHAQPRHVGRISTKACAPRSSTRTARRMVQPAKLAEVGDAMSMLISRRPKSSTLTKLQTDGRMTVMQHRRIYRTRQYGRADGRQPGKARAHVRAFDLSARACSVPDGSWRKASKPRGKRSRTRTSSSPCCRRATCAWVYLETTDILSASTGRVDDRLLHHRRRKRARVHAMAEPAGFRFLDAPVSGGVGGAQAGTLTFMVGGSDRRSPRQADSSSNGQARRHRRRGRARGRRRRSATT